MKLDVVGAQEAAQILGVEVPRITRWRLGGKMPPMVAHLEATPVWRFKDVALLARKGEWRGEAPEQLPLVGVREVARDMLGVNASQIGRWRREGNFPEPVLDRRPQGQPWKRGRGLGATPLWMREQIEEWQRERAA